MRSFSKEILRPGKYVKGGRSIEITPDDVQGFHDSYGQLAKRGLLAPLIWEHSDPGSPDGLPQQLSSLRDSLANATKHTAGWLKRTLVKDGRLFGVFDVPDDKDAQKLANQNVRFVSPELRKKWQAGDGSTFERVISHVALTHKPILVDQQPGFVQLSDAPENAVLSLSLEEFEAAEGEEGIEAEPLRLADDDDKNKPKGSGSNEGEPDKDRPADGEPQDPPPENPDMPADTGKDKKLEALLAHLEELGLPLPSDTDAESLVDRLLTAAKVRLAANQEGKDKKAAEEGGDGADEEGVMEKQTAPIMRFSELTQQIERLAEDQHITPGQKSWLMDRLEVLQLSETKEAAVQLSDLLKMFADGPKLGLFEQMSEGKHPDSAFYSTPDNGEQLSEEDMQKDVERLLKSTGRA